ncbi:MAG TPA: GNAT family N-acetyltransferase [Catenuloplanes sp.]
MSELPSGWSTRRPTLDDVPAILAVLQASDTAALGHPDSSADDVREALTGPHMDPRRDAWLALDPAGAVVGCAYLENPSAGQRDFVEVYVYPGRGLPAQRPLLDLALARVGERAAGFGHPVMTVRAGAIPNETDWVASLRAAGFAFVKRFARMRRSLDGVSPTPPVPPDGVTVRPVRPDDDADLRRFHQILETAFADSLDHEPIGYDHWRARLATLPSIAWDEWFVAEVDGEPVGALQSSDQCLDQNEGWVKMLAVLRGHRKRGVGAALLRRAFAEYAAKGRGLAGLGVDLTNPTEAVRLYESVGLTASYEADMYEREVPAA